MASGFTPTILIVEGTPARRATMRSLAEAQGFQVEQCVTRKDALARLRKGVPDVVWAGCEFPDGTLVDFVGVVRAAYPNLPVLILVTDELWEDGLQLVEEGAFDLVRDEDDPRLQAASLKRSMADARARAGVQEARGALLGTQSRLTTMGPTMANLLETLSDAFREAISRPDISLRYVETLCAQAMSRYVDGAPVAIMALERPALVLRPRGISHSMDAHDAAGANGFLLSRQPDNWREDLMNVANNVALTAKVKTAYGTRHCVLAALGPGDDPYGLAAFLMDHVQPPSPDDVEFMAQLAINAGHCIRIARHFRALLRRGNGGHGGTNPFGQAT